MTTFVGGPVDGARVKRIGLPAFSVEGRAIRYHDFGTRTARYSLTADGAFAYFTGWVT